MCLYALTHHAKILRMDQLIENGILIEITVLSMAYDSSFIQLKKEFQAVSKKKKKIINTRYDNQPM